MASEMPATPMRMEMGSPMSRWDGCGLGNQSKGFTAEERGP
jgi:hypothetical protein